jgi:hypothetical protein
MWDSIRATHFKNNKTASDLPPQEVTTTTNIASMPGSQKAKC